MNNVFIVILNLNRAKDTIECLKSINQLSIINYQLSILVVDNASTDDSVNKISNLKSSAKGGSAYGGQISNLELIVNKENLGFAAGNNVGIRYALSQGANYVMVLNNDTVVDKDLIIGLLKTFKGNPNAGVISPKIYFAKGFEFHQDRYKADDLGKVIWYAGGKIDWKNVYGTNYGVDEIDHGQFNKVRKVDFATGACAMFSTSTLKKVGLFNEKYFVYLEDTDLSQRIKLHGFDVLYSPEGLIWHKVAQSSSIGSDLNDYFITRNRLLFGFKYASLRPKIALIRESVKLGQKGRKWQKIGVRDFYLGKFGTGSWKEDKN